MGRMNFDIYVALVHSPIYNKRGEKITTTITNLDLHDIARAGKTYDIDKYYVINHLVSQQSMVRRMKKYWYSDYGAEYNSNRQQAFSIIEIEDTLEDVIEVISGKHNQKPVMVATDARKYPETISYKNMRDKIFTVKKPFLLIFGTGWGLTEETIDKCDYILEPIYGRGDFNHLSVRSAVSIILDRLLADKWW